MANSRSGESVVDRIIKVLSAFERAKPRLTVSALARETGLPNSTVHRLATELCDVGFLDRDAQGKVGIGMRMWELAASSNPLEEFRQRGRPVLEGIQEALRHDEIGRASCRERGGSAGGGRAVKQEVKEGTR